MRLPLWSKSVESEPVPPWWNVVCGALAIFLFAWLLFR